MHRALAPLAAFAALLLTACPPAGECQVDADCGDGFACREAPDATLVCIQVVDNNPIDDDPVAILSFTAAPATVVAGGTSTLSWESENATSCALSGGIGGVDTTGTLEVTVPDNDAFTLNCQGVDGPASATAAVAVEVAIVTFTATPAQLDELGSTTLAWTTLGAESCALELPGQLDEAVPLADLSEGTRALQPTTSGTVTLTCEGAAGPASATADVDLGRIIEITVTPPAIAAGQTTTLAWTEENATACAIAGETDADPDDDLLVVTPATSQTYSLRCTGFAGELRRDVEAVVLIERFAAQSETINSGDDAILEFDLDLRVASCSLDDATVVVPGDGSITIPSVTETFTRTLTCQDGTGDLVATSAGVTVTVP